MLDYLDEFPIIKYHYMGIVGKASQGKTLTTNLIKKLFAGQSDMTDYTIGITPFTDDLPKYFRIVDGPRQTGKHGL